MAPIDYDIQKLSLYLLLAISILKYFMFLWKRREMFIKSWNYPGPFNFPLIGSAHVFISPPGNLINVLLAIFAKYTDGFKFWFGPRLMYFISEPSQIERILKSYETLEKDELYGFISEYIGDGLLTLPPPAWKRHRKHISPTFSQQILNTFVEIFAERGLVLNEILAKNCNKKFDLFRCLSRCMLDITMETTMNLQLRVQEEDSDHCKTLESLMKLGNSKLFNLWNHSSFVWKILGNKKKMDNCLKKYNGLVDQVIQRKMEAMEHQKNNNISLTDMDEGRPKRLVFLDYLLETGTLSSEEIRNEINIFLFAGTDTSATALSFIFAIIGMYPEVQKNIFEEVTEVMGNDRMPSFKDLSLLSYTERVIKETLRLFPSICFFGRHLTKDFDMGDFIAPRHSSVIFLTMYIHRNPKYWPDPLRFDPNRFLPEEVAKRHPCTYIPFSNGPRNCIGIRYAMMNIKTIIATVIRKFEFHSEYKKIDDIKVKNNLLLRFDGNPKVIVTPRK